MTETYCHYCWPTKRKYHFLFYIEYYLEMFFGPLSRIFEFVSFRKKARKRNIFNFLLFGILELIGIVNFVENPTEKEVFNKSFILFMEAKRRRLRIFAITCLGKYTNHFKVIYKGRSFYYESNPLIFFIRQSRIDDKKFVKDKLQANNLPVARGNLFHNEDDALRFAHEIGYPVIVKPHSSSLSQHATYPINSDKELRLAMRIAKIIQPYFIVEKYIIGNLYRATVVGKTDLFVCQKERPYVLGNGEYTIRELIGAKNKHPFRGETHQRNTTLHKITIDETLEKELQKQKLSLDSVIPQNKIIYLSQKFTLSAGCEISNCIGETHQNNKDLFLKIARLFDTDIVGIDFICPDISKPYMGQQTAVLELNSLPAIDMHQFPSQGKAEPISKRVWDHFYRVLER